MTFQSIDGENKVEKVFYQIKKRILDGTWSLGEKLPSEKELCEMFGISRVTIRGAMQKLKSVGLIETYQGKGSFVTTKINLSDSVFSKLNITEKDLHDIVEFRELIEYKSFDLAVENATEEDIKLIENALNDMLVNVNDYKKYSIADYEFHLAIVKASKNKIFYTVMESIKPIFHYYLEELNRVFGVDEKSIQGHINILEAIKNKDAEAAKKIIEAGVEDNFSKLIKM